MSWIGKTILILLGVVLTLVVLKCLKYLKGRDSKNTQQSQHSQQLCQPYQQYPPTEMMLVPTYKTPLGQLQPQQLTTQPMQQPMQPHRVQYQPAQQQSYQQYTEYHPLLTSTQTNTIQYQQFSNKINNYNNTNFFIMQKIKTVNLGQQDTRAEICNYGEQLQFCAWAKMYKIGRLRQRDACNSTNRATTSITIRRNNKSNNHSKYLLNVE